MRTLTSSAVTYEGSRLTARLAAAGTAEGGQRHEDRLIAARRPADPRSQESLRQEGQLTGIRKYAAGCSRRKRTSLDVSGCGKVFELEDRAAPIHQFQEMVNSSKVPSSKNRT